MAKLPDRFLSCDWGTSSFRLRLVSSATDEILAEVQSEEGVKPLFQQRIPEWARPDLFAEIMRRNIHALAKQAPIERTALVISGMASSTIGWKELPYAHLPVAIDGAQLNIEEFDWEAPETIERTLLVSGIASDDDIMRGEECQTVGVFADPTMQRYAERAVLVLPGTHSKHVFVADRNILRFRTFMTGELFAVLSSHSVLAASVQSGEFDHLVGFVEGVEHVRVHGLIGSLFHVRTRAVLQNVKPWANAGFLSGLLIGAEVAELVTSFDYPIIVAGERADLYSMAFKLYGKDDVVTSGIDDATVAAHRTILARRYNEL